MLPPNSLWKSVVLSFAFAFPFTFAAGSARADAATGPWEKVSEKEGILVERRVVEGSNLKEFVGRAVVEASIGHVLAIIRDASRRCEWMPSCGGSKVVEEDIAGRVQYSYYRSKAPWPVSDRDSVNRAEMVIDTEKRRVYLPFEAVEYPKVPPIKGVVRMPFMRGHWALVPVDEKTTKVEYQVHAKPGGMLPDWLANLASKTLPRETISGLRLQVKKASYPAFEAQIAESAELKQMLAH